jgi:hypothetical protein
LIPFSSASIVTSNGCTGSTSTGYVAKDHRLQCRALLLACVQVHTASLQAAALTTQNPFRAVLAKTLDGWVGEWKYGWVEV